MTTYVIITDGSIQDPHKPSHGGYGYRINVYENDELRLIHEDGGMLDKTTNNVMELSAIRDSLEYMRDYLLKNGVRESDQIVVISDSEYAVLSYTKYIFGWVRRMKEDGILRKSDNKPIENGEIIKSTYANIVGLKKLCPLFIYHINSHLPKNMKGRTEAMEKFKKKNNCLITIQLFNKIADQNELVDQLAKKFMMKKGK